MQVVRLPPVHSTVSVSPAYLGQLEERHREKCPEGALRGYAYTSSKSISTRITLCIIIIIIIIIVQYSVYFRPRQCQLLVEFSS